MRAERGTFPAQPSLASISDSGSALDLLLQTLPFAEWQGFIKVQRSGNYGVKLKQGVS